jgi:hypothetical protein
MPCSLYTRDRIACRPQPHRYSPGHRVCNLLESRLARGLSLESRLARLGLLEMRLARAILSESPLASLAKRNISRNALAKRKTSRFSLAKRDSNYTTLAKRKSDRASLAKRDSSRSLPHQTQKRLKPGDRPVKRLNTCAWKRGPAARTWLSPFAGETDG